MFRKNVPRIRASAAEGTLKLSVLLLFDDGISLRRAKGILHGVAMRLARPVILNLKACAIRLLRDALVRIQVSLVAREADLVVVSCHGAKPGRSEVKFWLTRSKADRRFVPRVDLSSARFRQKEIAIPGGV